MVLLGEWKLLFFDENFSGSHIYAAQRMKFSIKDFSVNVTKLQETLDLVIFAEEIHNKKLHFLFSAMFFFSPKNIRIGSLKTSITREWLAIKIWATAP